MFFNKNVGTTILEPKGFFGGALLKRRATSKSLFLCSRQAEAEAVRARKPNMTMSWTKWIAKAHVNPCVSIMLLPQIHPAVPAIKTPAHPDGWPKK
jgi:hypothetical protein